LFPYIIQSGEVTLKNQKRKYNLVRNHFTNNINDKLNMMESCFDKQSIAILGIQLVRLC
jgi:hypothetical protein